jgi:hypothetical protein
MSFHGSFEEIHLLFHDTVERSDIFVAFHHLLRVMGLCEGSTRWEEAAVRSSMPLVSDVLREEYCSHFCQILHFFLEFSRANLEILKICFSVASLESAFI